VGAGLLETSGDGVVVITVVDVDAVVVDVVVLGVVVVTFVSDSGVVVGESVVPSVVSVCAITFTLRKMERQIIRVTNIVKALPKSYSVVQTWTDQT